MQYSAPETDLVPHLAIILESVTLIYTKYYTEYLISNNIDVLHMCILFAIETFTLCVHVITKSNHDKNLIVDLQADHNSALTHIYCILVQYR